MSKLFALICLTGVAGLLLVGGCTPEAENTWSESLDFGGMDPRVNTVNGTYGIFNDIDSRFTAITLTQVGGTVQGHDNMRRSWRGTAYGTVPPGASATYGEFLNFQIQTNDGPEGQVVLAGTVYIYMMIVDGVPVCWRALRGMMYQGDGPAGVFDTMYTGPSVPCELEQD
jgi:hypothetical protein